MSIASPFRFCPKCGGSFSQQEHGEQTVPTCTNASCGFIFWQNAKPCVAALVSNDRGELLLTRRGIEPDKDKLDLPGGFLYADEEPEAGIARETREELGVTIAVGDCVGHFIDDYGAAEFKNLVIGFAATIVDGEPYAADPHEITEIVWRDPTAVSPDELAFENNRRFLEAWLQQQ